MGRLGALAVVLLWTVAPGCFHDPARPSPTGQARLAEPSQALLDQEASICGRLDVEALPDALEWPGEVEVRARFENCGATPLTLGPYTCALVLERDLLAPLTLPRLDGASCADEDLPPGATLVWNATWNATIPGACYLLVEIHDPDPPCPWWEDAPAGNYTVRATAQTWERSHTRTATTRLSLAPWTERHDAGWREFHPAWQVGGNLTWRDATVAIPPGAHGATDGVTWLYVSEGALLAHDAREARCAPDDPGKATWVRLSASPCRWAPFPGVVLPGEA